MQFRLSTLFLLFVVLWSSLAVFGLSGIAVFVAAVALAVGIHYAGGLWSWGQLAMVVLVLSFLLALLLPGVQYGSDQTPTSVCADNMRQIALALHNYHGAYNCFPPAYLADHSGKPIHSWRVLILPYLGYEDLYKQYSFNEPWDGPNNSKLLKCCPSEYVCRSDQGGPPSGVSYAKWASKKCPHTDYAAVVGSNAAWPGKEPGKHTGDSSKTIMLVEVADAGIQWSEPRDVSLDALLAASPGCVTTSSKHFSKKGSVAPTACDGVNVSLADGDGWFLPRGLLDSDKFPGLLKVGGFRKEYLEADWSNAGRHNHWTNCAALAVWLASSGWLLVRAVRSRKKASAVGAEGPQQHEQ